MMALWASDSFQFSGAEEAQVENTDEMQGIEKERQPGQHGKKANLYEFRTIHE